MVRYVGAQVTQLLVVVFGVLTITFVVLRITGNPVDSLLPPNATQQERQLLIRELGLDKPIPVQYATFLGQAVRGDFGHSIITEQPAEGVVLAQMPSSLILAFLAAGASTIVGVAGGTWAAIRHNRWPDRVVTIVAVAGQAMPVYWLGLILIIIFAVTLNLLPASGEEGVSSLILPVATLSVALLPYVLRVARSTMLDVLRSDFVRFHRAKGLSETSIVLRHALKNSLGPIITLLGLQAGPILVGVVAIEYVFGRSGMGSLLINSIYSRDYPVVQAAVFTIALLVVGANFAADLLVAYIDPRVRLGARA